MSNVRTARGPFRRTGSRIIYKNSWIRVREDQVIRPDGAKGIFGVVTLQYGVSVVPIDRDGFCYCIREYGYALNRTTLKLAAGSLEQSETPLAAAKRELREELGLQSSSWHQLGNVHYYSMVLNTKEHLFLACDVKKVAEQSTEDRNLIKVVRLPWKTAVAFSLNGRMTHAECALAILRADRYLRQKRYGFAKG